MKELFDRARGGTTTEAVEGARRRLRRAGIALIILALAVLWMWLHR
jgi:uncharacterized protein YjeT (DUF2065 family)